MEVNWKLHEIDPANFVLPKSGAIVYHTSNSMLFEVSVLED
jgi:hypothetical protein